MENLELLKRHKKKTVYGHAFVKFAFIYLCILIFLFTWIYFRDKNENTLLLAKADKVISFIEEEPEENVVNESVINAFREDVFDNAYIYRENWEILNYINNEVSLIDIEENNIEKIGWFKYYFTQFKKWPEIYFITVRELSSDFLKEAVITLVILVLVAPFLYFLLFWISERSLRLLYRPIEDIIMSLEWFAANINHEFKTSLSEIISSLELAEITKQYETPTKDSIASAKRLNDTLDSLSLMIHFVNSDYRREKINLIKQLDESLKDFSTLIEDKNLSIIKKYSPKTDFLIVIDKAPLMLCFTNILKNAIRYSKEGWTIEITIEKDYFSIKDYWVGISKENLNNIFDRYFREKYAGSWSGIGLSLVKKISDTYKWDVSVESEKDVFTEFKISF